MIPSAPQLDAIHRAVDTIPLYGWVPCAAAKQTSKNPRRGSYGLGSNGWDFGPMLADGEKPGLIRRHMNFGVDGLFVWLPFGNPSTNKFQSFDGWLTLTPEQQVNCLHSLMAIEAECQRLGMTRRNIYYLGSPTGFSWQIPADLDGNMRDMSRDEALAWVKRCAGPLPYMDCDIAFDNTGPRMTNAVGRQAILDFAEELRKQGRAVYAEATVKSDNEEFHGFPSVELEQAHTINREGASLYEKGSILRIVPDGKIRRWTSATGDKNWPIDGAMVLRDCARRAMELRRECGLVVAWDHVAGAKSDDELRAKAKALNPPTPYWRTA